MRRRHAVIKKCRPQDKQEGRKFPVEEQDFCLWSKKDPDDLLMAGPKKAVEQQEKNVQFFKQKAASFIVNGQVFRRATLQLFIPPSQPNVPHVRTAATKKEVEKWASQVYKFAHRLEDELQGSVEEIDDAAFTIGSAASKYDSLLDRADKFAMMEVLSEAYGSEGLRLVENSNQLSELVRERFRWAEIVEEYLTKLLDAGLGEDEPSVTYLMEAAAALDVISMGGEATL
jgi:hypothetical protein